jgi:hypothetical protein
LSKARMLYLGLVAALMVGMFLVRAYAGDPNPDPHIIGALPL